MPHARKLLKYFIIALILFALGWGIYYGAVRPDRTAKIYASQVNATAKKLNGDFVTLAKTTNLNLFNTPDASPASNKKDLQTISAAITAARSELKVFAAQIRQLHPDAAPITPSAYHNATILQQHASDIIAQANDVLDQYNAIVIFLQQYYALNATFVDQTTAINAVPNLDSLIPIAYQVYNGGDQLAGIAKKAKQLAAPADYKKLPAAAAAVYNQAANGFYTLAYGLTINYDPDKNNGIAEIEAAANQYDSSLADLPTTLAQSSYVLQQVTELPDKTTNLIEGNNQG